MSELEAPFGLAGKAVKIVKGPHEGMSGEIIKETGYTGYGVVCRISLENGKVVEYSADFWEIAD